MELDVNCDFYKELEARAIQLLKQRNYLDEALLARELDISTGLAYDLLWELFEKKLVGLPYRFGS